MTQTALQSAEQFPWRYKPGESGNPLGPTAARKLRVDAKCRELAAEYGGWDGLSVVERTLIEQAAALPVRRKPLSAEDAVRSANVIARLLSVVDRRRGKHRKAEGPSILAYLADRAANNANTAAADEANAAAASTDAPAAAPGSSSSIP